MNKSEIENLIDSKLNEAKLAVSERLLKFALAMGAGILTIFGIALPLFLSTQSSGSGQSHSRNAGWL